jgi:hypothetical protein
MMGVRGGGRVFLGSFTFIAIYSSLRLVERRMFAWDGWGRWIIYMGRRAGRLVFGPLLNILLRTTTVVINGKNMDGMEGWVQLVQYDIFRCFSGEHY